MSGYRWAEPYSSTAIGSPYEGRTLHGVVRSTWLRGERVYDGHAFDGEHAGKWQRWDRR